MRLPRRQPDTLAARWSQLEPHIEVARPAGPGPFPVALMFHGCGGRRPYLADYMADLAAAGILAVSIDSFAPRRIARVRALATVCTGADLQGWLRAGDVLASVWGVRTLAGADPDRVALCGWSHGGWAIMDLMTMALARPGEAGLADPDPALRDAVQALALAYPYCGPGALSLLRPWRAAPRVFGFVGAADQVANPALCRRAFRTAERAGAQLETWFPEGATHAFDEYGNEFSWFRFNEAAFAEARSRVTGFLADAFALAPAGTEP